MLTDRLAYALAALGRLGGAPGVHAACRVTEIAARGVPGCAGATVTLWEREEVVDSTVSHPDLGVLLDLQHRTGDGPVPAAHRSGETVLVTETMRDDRWSDFARTAVRYGVRSLIVVPLVAEDIAVTFALYAVRPRAFDEPSTTPVAGLLAQQLAVALRNADAYQDAAGEASQLRAAVASRAEIEQAKGIIMYTRGVDPDTAFGELRRVSQRTQTKVSEVARRIVQNYSSASRSRQH